MLTTLTRVFKHTTLANLLQKRSRFYATMVGERRLEGKVALITGSASGLGKATAHHFVHHGAQVIIADNDTILGPQVAKDLGPSARYVECDIAVEAQVEEAVNVAMAHYGKLDVMYNNAGIPGPSVPPSIADLDLDEFDKVMRINIRGMLAGIKHAARVMIPMGSGSILCTSSISGVMGGLGPHPYTISKFTIPGVVKSVASELCKVGVRINCISPAPIPTPMVLAQIQKFYPGLPQEQIEGIVQNRRQCRHKMEKLRKRYPTEIQRVRSLPLPRLINNSTAPSPSSWIYFKSMDSMEKRPQQTPYRHRRRHQQPQFPRRIPTQSLTQSNLVGSSLTQSNLVTPSPPRSII